MTTRSALEGIIHQILKPTVLRALLICGILAPIFFLSTDILAGTLYPGYIFISQAVSELFAIGAPTSHLVVSLFTASDLLLVVFASGVWVSSAATVAATNRNHHHAQRFMALMIIANAVNSLMLWNFFPMHMRGVQPTFTDTIHVILATNPFVLATVVLGVAAFRNWFRFYSIGTILILLIPAILGFSYVPQVGANQPTPWLGLTERVSIYGNMIWHLVLAIVLLDTQISTRWISKISQQHTIP